jgi:hypothetical protein
MKRLAEGYVNTAIIVFNLLVIAVALNVMLAGVSFIRASLRTVNPVTQKYGNERLAKVYPGKTPQEIDQLLSESWSRPIAYETFTQFMERPFRGQYVNVAAAGFRFSAHQGPWPLDPRAFNVFAFGGSTTFGYGVADSETISSQLQEQLRRRTGQPINIYNFGRAYYYSTQERILFEKLLTGNQRPQLAIFIDGLNDFYYRGNVAQFTSQFEQFVASGSGRSQFTSRWEQLDALGSGRAPQTTEEKLLDLAATLPIVRIAARLFPESESPVTKAPQKLNNDFAEPEGVSEDAEARAMLDRYFANKKMIEAIAAAYNVNAAFVWQPVPMFGYDLNSHLFPENVYIHNNLSAIGYSLLGDFGADNFLRCDALQKDRHEPLYVDNVHYTVAFSKEVASCIADQLIVKRLLTAP